MDPAPQPPARWRGPALAGLLLLAFALRAPWLGSVPGPLHPDEAADAVHARDLPSRPALTFPHEGGGWDEGTYVWLAAPCVRAAGALGWPSVEAALRLPALAAGLALVAAMWALGAARSPRLAALAALSVAVTPWAVHASRLGLRAALVPPLVVLGLALLERGARPALAGAWLLAAAAATYTPARLVVPLLAAVHVATLEPRPTARRALALLAPCALVTLLLLPWTLGPEGAVRLAQVSALDADASLPELAWRVTRGWGLHFSTRFLFSGASSRGFAPEGVGLLPLGLAPLLVLGLLRVLAGARARERAALRLLAWLALAPLAAALTSDAPNALRDILALPALALVIALGGDALLERVPVARRALAAVALLAFILGAASRPLATYLLVHPAREGAFYYAGRRELARAIGARAAAGEAILVRAPFVLAYVRLYAPEAPVARGADGAVVIGLGPPRWEVRVRDGLRAGDRAFGEVVLRPLDP